MERAHSYIQEIKENIRRVLDLPPCTSEDFLPPGPRHDPRSIIASLQNHLEAVLAGTSNGPMDVASIVWDETTVPSSLEQDRPPEGEETLLFLVILLSVRSTMH